MISNCTNIHCPKSYHEHRAKNKTKIYPFNSNEMIQTAAKSCFVLHCVETALVPYPLAFSTFVSRSLMSIILPM